MTQAVDTGHDQCPVCGANNGVSERLGSGVCNACLDRRVRAAKVRLSATGLRTLVSVGREGSTMRIVALHTRTEGQDGEVWRVDVQQSDGGVDSFRWTLPVHVFRKLRAQELLTMESQHSNNGDIPNALMVSIFGLSEWGRAVLSEQGRANGSEL